jgi:crotonobetainyl-CoA:carnitine CoA-transferase CaiB-like acyl-CoA transferase
VTIGDGQSSEQADTHQGGLAGIRVLELGGGVGLAWLTKLFADLGADVIRVEGEADVVRARPYDVHRWLNTSKRCVTQIAELANDADLVVHDASWPPSELVAFGVDRASGRRPGQVVLAFTPFGLDGPYAGFKAEELNVIHGCSWGNLSPATATDATKPPLKAPGHHATIGVATEAAAVALAAVEQKHGSNDGEHIDFSSFAAGAKITEFAPAVVSFLETDASRFGARSVSPWGIYECVDGLMQIICPEQPQWESLVHLMGDPEWALLDVFAESVGRSENSDVIELKLGEWVATQYVDALYLAAQTARVAMTPVTTMAQLEANAQFEARGFFSHTPDGEKMLGPGCQFDQPWWALRSSAADRGVHDGEGWLERDLPLEGEKRDPGGRPLDGVRVCDFTWIWAGPACTQILAHLGADVVKLESPEHQCMFRRLPFNPPDVPLDVDTGGAFQLYNSDKRSIGIDIGHPDATDIVRRLVEQSDVVVDNFGAGTMARLGYGVDDLRAMNPDVIVVSLSGYGQTGPAASYMAYGPAGGSLAGLYAANGHEGRGATETGIAIGDPSTGITAAWATVAALAARKRGQGAGRVDVSMVEAMAATVGELWMSYQSQGISPVPMGNHDAVWAPHNCYPASGDDQWVTIACTDDESWGALVQAINPSLQRDARFDTAEGRKANEEALDELVAAWTSTRDRWEVTHLLQDAGVAAFPSLSPAELWNGDPQLEAIGMLERPDHPRTGMRVIPGVPWRLASGPNGLQRPAPLLGQHTDEVLADLLGYASDEIDDLAARRVVHRSAT